MSGEAKTEKYPEWFGRIFERLDQYGRVLDEIKGELTDMREKLSGDMDDLDKRVTKLEIWKEAHEKAHKEARETVRISKATIVSLLSALIASGLIGYLFGMLRGG